MEQRYDYAAERTVAIPLTVIGTTVSHVLSAKFAERIRADRGDFLHPFLRASAWLGLIAVLTGSAFVLLGPTLVPWFLGEEWTQSGRFVQIIAAATSIRIVTGPLSSLFPLLELARANVALDMLRTVLMVSADLVSSRLTLPIGPSLLLLYGALGVTHFVLWLYLAVHLWRMQRGERQ